VICGLRDYGTATWEGGKDGCDHMGKPMRTTGGLRDGWDSKNGTLPEQMKSAEKRTPYKETCGKCGAKRIDNQLGLEKTVEEYIKNTVIWAREVWRVSRTDGCFFLNLGDSYAGSWGNSGSRDGGQRSINNERLDRKAWDNHTERPASSFKQNGLKPKDLCEIPSDVVRALRADGWYLRSRMPWVKRSAMPESCTDRPASALEYMFLLTKSSKYYFDMDAIRKGVTGNAHAGRKDEELSPRYGANDMGGHNQRSGTWKQSYLPNSRNFRNTDLFYQSLEEPHGAIFCGEEMVGLDVNPQAYSEAHFATFPDWLVTPLIKAGTSEKGACPECGTPWERMVEELQEYKEWTKSQRYYGKGGKGSAFREAKTNSKNVPQKSKTIGWQPTCKCGHKEPVPCVVLDPFGGSGTTKNVADRLGRRGIMCELKMEYIEMAKKRCYQLPGLF